MINVYVNRKIVDSAWGGGNKIVKGIFKFGEECGLDVSNRLDQNTDVALVINPHFDNPTGMLGINEIIRVQRLYKPSLKIVNRVNEKNLGRIPQEDRFDHVYIETSKHVDASIFVSDWLRNYYFLKKWHCNKSVVIHNGVDKSIFKNYNNKLSSENGKINIITHHWSNNIAKGFKFYEAVERMCEEHSDKFTFTYMGRHRDNFKTANLIGPYHGEKIGIELSKYDLYISASQFESGPNHVLEALACDLPVLILDRAGGGIEMVNNEKNHFSDEKELVRKILESDYSTDIKYNTKDMKDYVMEISDFFRELVEENR